ncbi:MAG TPA: HAMP domain-containing sensor histidine kinase [Acidimicrobiales bacterium]|nr:HAMP domain-containing sensor histidine kinase [Acidimicrobiales bacterium]
MSLRARLLIAIGIITIVTLAIANVVTYSALQSFLYQRIDQQLDQSHVGIEAWLNGGHTLSCYAIPGQAVPGANPSVGSGPGVNDQDNQPPSNAIEVQAVEVRTPTGAIVGSQICAANVNDTNYTPQLPRTITGFTRARNGEHVAYFVTPATRAGGPDFRVRASILKDGNQLIVAQPLGNTVSTLHQLLLVELVASAGGVVLALIGGLWLVRLGLRPLLDMERTAETIAAGNLTERVPGENEKTEVGRLARTLNVMLTRIETAFKARLASERRLRDSEQRLRRFVADASHELRTPIAAVSAYAELFGRGASENKDDLERLMNGIRNETGRMERLVADLLLLARLDERRPLEYQSVDLVALCAEAVQTASTVGPQWPVTFEATEPVEIMGDPTGIRQVVDNLLGNVRAHTPAGTTARVSVGRDTVGAVIRVADTGPGMDSDEAQLIFERFYRSDPSRSRLHGGAGLGLSIVSAIVAGHGGTVSAEGQPGVGTTFTVHFPFAPATAPLAAEDDGPNPERRWDLKRR